MMRWFYYRYIYRRLMVWLHKHDMHHMPEHGPYDDGRYQKWCQWCGLRISYHKNYSTYILGREALMGFDLPKKA